MKSLPDFPLLRRAKLSQLFVDRNITHFHEAIACLKRLPYQRTSEARELSCVLSKSGGSFTARNALLVQLAHEQGVSDLRLSLCMHEFDQNCAGVRDILSRQGLINFPEARGCIKYQGQLFTVASDALCLNAEVLSEIEIAPAQIGVFKQRYHKNYLGNWLQLEKLDQIWSVETLWSVRTECLRHIAMQWNECLRSVL